MSLPAPTPTFAPAPRTLLDADGRPHWGAHLGELETVSWEALRPRPGALERRLRHKRWHFVSMANAACVAAFAIIDLNWAASAFAYVFDRRTRTLRADRSWLGIPGLSVSVSSRPGAGASSWFRRPGVRLSLERSGTSWQVRARAGDLAIDATLDATTAAPTLCAIGPVEGGLGNCTHKTAGLMVRGEARVAGERFDLDGATAAFDHTDGLLARRTTWRWANAASPALSFNMTQGFLGEVENIVWLKGRAFPVGAVDMRYETPRGPWTIRTACGRVDLRFTPEGARAEDKDLVIAASRYVQPIGTFAGTIRPPDGPAIEVADLVGVTEDHAARW